MKVSQYDEATSVGVNDEFLIVQGGVTKKVKAERVGVDDMSGKADKVPASPDPTGYLATFDAQGNIAVSDKETSEVGGDVSGKADKVATSPDPTGNVAQLDAAGNLVDSTFAASDLHAPGSDDQDLSGKADKVSVSPDPTGYVATFDSNGNPAVSAKQVSEIGGGGGGISSNDAPVNAVAAAGVLWLLQNPPVHGENPGPSPPQDDFVITIGTQEFIFVAASPGRQTAGEITLGADQLETAANMVTAFEADVPDITAQSIGYDDYNGYYGVLITAAEKGEDGNAIEFSTNDGETTTFSISGATLEGGVDGTVGAKNEIRQSGDMLYVCTATNTVNDANWKQYTAQRKKVIEIVMTGAAEMTHDDVAFWVVPEEYDGWKVVRVAASLLFGNDSGEDVRICVCRSSDYIPLTLNDLLIADGTTSTRDQEAPFIPLTNPLLILTAGEWVVFGVNYLPLTPPGGPLVVELVIEEPIGG
jgi:hypothetical protein